MSPTLLAVVVTALAAAPSPASAPAYGPRLEGFAYPHPVRTFALSSQGQALEMAYLDVAPARASNGRTVVLLHGKNFCAATWEETIAALTGAGYRVVAPDQVGFCKSSKPQRYQFSFHQLADNTRALLTHLGVKKPIVMGHSMGGMLAVRYALMFADDVAALALVNPIGLEDWKAKGVPWRSVDAAYAKELETTAESVRAYQKSTYYAGTWRPAYDRWVDMLAGMYRGDGKAQVAWSAALTSDMIFTQPVVHELESIAVPVTLFIGTRDTTAIGKDAAAPAVRATLGDYTKLGKAAAKRIPRATLVEWDDLGHSPHVQDPARFHTALLDALQSAQQRKPVE